MLEECLAPLTGLRDLHLTVKPFDAALVAAVGRSAVGMPDLQHVSITPCGGNLAHLSGAHADWPDGLLELPARGHYKFMTATGNLERGLFDEVTRKLTARGATVVERTMSQTVTFAR